MDSTSREQRLFDAHDAYSSTLLLASLLICSVVINVITAWGLMPNRTLLLRAGFGLYSLVVLVCLGATWRRPRIGLAERLQAVMLASFLLLFPLGGVTWRNAGRPWEIFSTGQAAMMAVALAAPRSLRLSLGLVAVLLVEAIGLQQWLLHSGAQLPLGEPGVTVIFAVVSVAMLVLRRRRRAMALRYLRRSADALALAQLATQLQQVAADVQGAVSQLGATLGRLGGDQAVVNRVSRAIDRITTVSTGLSETVKTTAPPPTSADELAFHNRDAHESALTVAVIVTIAELVSYLSLRRYDVGRLPLFYIALGSMAAASAIALVLTRKSPSRSLAEALFFLMIVPAFVQVCYAIPMWAKPGAAFQPLIGPKVFLLVVPLVMPRRPLLAVALELLMAFAAIDLYYHHHLDALRSRSTLAEPWITLFYLLIGLALVVTRENRRATSVRLMRADAQAAALVTSTTVSLQLLHDLGTPLQVLTAGVELLKDEDGATVVRVREALAQLVAATRQVPPADPEVFRQVGESFQNV